ncbi:hypothetical protein [Emticicia agri]|uniref:Glycosyltransferase RgtA/B/C/D-like domain-containing protein n=1 Tax=Emticicia agri TaxID=2492393 RepID=A0A4Q5M395_9BACT|nr:hypothetical protein [Emticicia agri]RYU96529.1 hypothetical protein EWM59_06865 [Emticicia agri]
METLAIFIHIITGAGLLSIFRIHRHFIAFVSLAFLLGIGLASFIPFLLECIHININQTTVLSGLIVLAIISIISCIINKNFLSEIITSANIKIRLYEIPFFLITAYFIYISVWKCYFYPNIPFDTIVGPELIAKATFFEQTLKNSIYTDFLPKSYPLSNQPYYAPFIMLMQVVYLCLGSFFGKVWLSGMVLAFFLYFYFELRHYIHPILAGWLLILLWFMPELYAYTYLVQTDYPNAIFLLIAFSFLYRYYLNEVPQKADFWLSSIFFAFACWTRTETILFLPVVLLFLYKQKFLQNAIIYSILPLILFLGWNYLFLGIVVPKAVPLGTIHLDFNNYFSRGWDTLIGTHKIMFDTTYWNYSFILFFILLLINISLYRTRTELIKLSWVMGVHIIFMLIVLHIEGANIPFTFRRGFFKIIFLTLFYAGTSQLLINCSKWAERVLENR